MIKEALEYIVGLREAKLVEVYSDTYSDKPLQRIDPYFPMANSLKVSTLTGFIDYIKSETDEMAEKMIVEVVSPTHVSLFSCLNGNREREYLIEACAGLPSFRYGSFIDQEAFCICLQSKFVRTKDRDLLLKFAGTVEAGTVAQYGDDGVSQKATIKTGIASKGDAIIPNPVLLKPYRTFLEVDQPESAFIFRMKECGGINCAIFEADGGAWEMEAMQNVKEYLQDELKDYPQITVIA